MTLYHHSVSVYHSRVETEEDVAVLGGKAWSATPGGHVTRLVSDIPGGRGVKDQMACRART
jgi:hypothetical protein